jgi:hypothetical protein
MIVFDVYILIGIILSILFFCSDLYEKIMVDFEGYYLMSTMTRFEFRLLLSAMSLVLICLLWPTLLIRVSGIKIEK